MLAAFAYERTEDRANGWTEKMNGQREINKRSRPDSFLGYEEHWKQTDLQDFHYIYKREFLKFRRKDCLNFVASSLGILRYIKIYIRQMNIQIDQISMKYSLIIL